MVLCAYFYTTYSVHIATQEINMIFVLLLTAVDWPINSNSRF